jgi:hypothetical protein
MWFLTGWYLVTGTPRCWTVVATVAWGSVVATFAFIMAVFSRTGCLDSKEEFMAAVAPECLAGNVTQIDFDLTDCQRGWTCGNVTFGYCDASACNGVRRKCVKCRLANCSRMAQLYRTCGGIMDNVVDRFTFWVGVPVILSLIAAVVVLLAFRCCRQTTNSYDMIYSTGYHLLTEEKK